VASADSWAGAEAVDFNLRTSLSLLRFRFLEPNRSRKEEILVGGDFGLEPAALGLGYPLLCAGSLCRWRASGMCTANFRTFPSVDSCHSIGEVGGVSGSSSNSGLEGCEECEFIKLVIVLREQIRPVVDVRIFQDW